MVIPVEPVFQTFMAPCSEKNKQREVHPTTVSVLLQHFAFDTLHKSQAGLTWASVKYKTFRINCHFQSSQHRSAKKVTVQGEMQSAHCLAAALRREPERRLSKHLQRSLWKKSLMHCSSAMSICNCKQQQTKQRGKKNIYIRVSPYIPVLMSALPLPQVHC